MYSRIDTIKFRKLCLRLDITLLYFTVQDEYFVFCIVKVFFCLENSFLPLPDRNKENKLQETASIKKTAAIREEESKQEKEYYDTTRRPTD